MYARNAILFIFGMEINLPKDAANSTKLCNGTINFRFKILLLVCVSSSLRAAFKHNFIILDEPNMQPNSYIHGTSRSVFCKVTGAASWYACHWRVILGIECGYKKCYFDKYVSLMLHTTVAFPFSVLKIAFTMVGSFSLPHE
jgi:hypothetical protein